VLNVRSGLSLVPQSIVVLCSGIVPSGAVALRNGEVRFSNVTYCDGLVR
jgi:hypothetical protein